MEAPASDAPRIRVAALIATGQQVILVRHAKDGSTYHLLPGGGVEPGERLTDALIREVREETGLEIEPLGLAFVSDSIAPDGHRHVVQVVFAARVIGGTVTDAPQDPRVAGVDVVELASLDRYDLRPPLAQHITSFADQTGEAPDARYIAAPWTAEGPGEA